MLYLSVSSSFLQGRLLFLISSTRLKSSRIVSSNLQWGLVISFVFYNYVKLWINGLLSLRQSLKFKSSGAHAENIIGDISTRIHDSNCERMVDIFEKKKKKYWGRWKTIYGVLFHDRTNARMNLYSCSVCALAWMLLFLCVPPEVPLYTSYECAHHCESRLYRLTNTYRI